MTELREEARLDSFLREALLRSAGADEDADSHWMVVVYLALAAAALTVAGVALALWSRRFRRVHIQSGTVPLDTDLLPIECESGISFQVRRSLPTHSASDRQDEPVNANFLFDEALARRRSDEVVPVADSEVGRRKASEQGSSVYESSRNPVVDANALFDEALARRRSDEVVPVADSEVGRRKASEQGSSVYESSRNPVVDANALFDEALARRRSDEVVPVADSEVGRRKASEQGSSVSESSRKPVVDANALFDEALARRRSSEKVPGVQDEVARRSASEQGRGSESTRMPVVEANALFDEALARRQSEETPDRQVSRTEASVPRLRPELRGQLDEPPEHVSSTDSNSSGEDEGAEEPHTFRRTRTLSSWYEAEVTNDSVPPDGADDDAEEVLAARDGSRRKTKHHHLHVHRASVVSCDSSMSSTGGWYMDDQPTPDGSTAQTMSFNLRDSICEG